MEPSALEVTVVAVEASAVEVRLLEGLRREGIPVREILGPGWPADRAPARPAEPRGSTEKPGDHALELEDGSAADRPEGRSPAPAAAEPTAPAACYLWFPSVLSLPELARCCAELDRHTPRPGLLAVAAPTAVEDLLAAGADDAVPRHISERELAARLRALHRRLGRRAPQGQLRYGALTLDTMERAAWIDGTIVSITPIEQAVLVALIRAAGRALTRVALLDAAWGDGELEVSERAVDNVILRLRRKLPRPEVIETVRGVGFRLASPATSLDVRRLAGA